STWRCACCACSPGPTSRPRWSSTTRCGTATPRWGWRRGGAPPPAGRPPTPETSSLFPAKRKLRALLAEVYEEPQRTVVVSEALHAIIGHRRRGVPYTLEAGAVRVADALDMAQGRSRIPFEAGRIGIHSLSAAAVDEVDI